MEENRIVFRAIIKRENKESFTNYLAKVLLSDPNKWIDVYSFSTELDVYVDPNKNHLSDLINFLEVDILGFSKIEIEFTFYGETDINVYVDDVLKHKEFINHKYHHKLINTIFYKVSWLFFENYPIYTIKEALNELNEYKRLERDFYIKEKIKSYLKENKK